MSYTIDQKNFLSSIINNDHENYKTLRKTIDPSFANSIPYVVACEYNKNQIVKDLSKDERINHNNPLALIFAVEKNYPEVVDLIINNVTIDNDFQRKLISKSIQTENWRVTDTLLKNFITKMLKRKRAQFEEEDDEYTDEGFGDDLKQEREESKKYSKRRKIVEDTISPKGFKIDELMSGLEKYMLRGSNKNTDINTFNIVKALFCANELIHADLFTQQSLITQLRTFYCRFISSAEPFSFFTSYKILNKMEKIVNSDELSFLEGEERNEFINKNLQTNLSKIIYLYSISRKNRMVNNVNFLFFKDPTKIKEKDVIHVKYEMKEGQELVTLINQFLTNFYLRMIKKDLYYFKQYQKIIEKIEKKIKKFVDIFQKICDNYFSFSEDIFPLFEIHYDKEEKKFKKRIKFDVKKIVKKIESQWSDNRKKRERRIKMLRYLSRMYEWIFKLGNTNIEQFSEDIKKIKGNNKPFKSINKNVQKFINNFTKIKEYKEKLIKTYHVMETITSKLFKRPKNVVVDETMEIFIKNLQETLTEIKSNTNNGRLEKVIDLIKNVNIIVKKLIPNESIIEEKMYNYAALIFKHELLFPIDFTIGSKKLKSKTSHYYILKFMVDFFGTDGKFKDIFRTLLNRHEFDADKSIYFITTMVLCIDFHDAKDKKLDVPYFSSLKNMVKILITDLKKMKDYFNLKNIFKYDKKLKEIIKPLFDMKSLEFDINFETLEKNIEKLKKMMLKKYGKTKDNLKEFIGSAIGILELYLLYLDNFFVSYYFEYIKKKPIIKFDDFVYDYSTKKGKKKQRYFKHYYKHGLKATNLYADKFYLKGKNLAYVKDIHKLIKNNLDKLDKNLENELKNINTIYDIQEKSKELKAFKVKIKKYIKDQEKTKDKHVKKRKKLTRQIEETRKELQNITKIINLKDVEDEEEEEEIQKIKRLTKKQKKILKYFVSIESKEIPKRIKDIEIQVYILKDSINQASKEEINIIKQHIKKYQIGEVEKYEKKDPIKDYAVEITGLLFEGSRYIDHDNFLKLVENPIVLRYLTFSEKMLVEEEKKPYVKTELFPIRDDKGFTDILKLLKFYLYDVRQGEGGAYFSRLFRGILFEKMGILKNEEKQNKFLITLDNYLKRHKEWEKKAKELTSERILPTEYDKYIYFYNEIQNRDDNDKTDFNLTIIILRSLIKFFFDLIELFKKRINQRIDEYKETVEEFKIEENFSNNLINTNFEKFDTLLLDEEKKDTEEFKLYKKYYFDLMKVILEDALIIDEENLNFNNIKTYFEEQEENPYITINLILGLGPYKQKENETLDEYLERKKMKLKKYIKIIQRHINEMNTLVDLDDVKKMEEEKLKKVRDDETDNETEDVIEDENVPTIDDDPEEEEEEIDWKELQEMDPNEVSKIIPVKKYVTRRVIFIDEDDKKIAKEFDYDTKKTAKELEESKEKYQKKLKEINTKLSKNNAKLKVSSELLKIYKRMLNTVKSLLK